MSKGLGNRFFTEKNLIGNLMFKQDIGIPMVIEPASFWANLFLYFFYSKHIQNLISKKLTRAYKYHATCDDLCIINDDDKFSKSFKRIYPGKLELKLERSRTHATFLDLDIKIEDGVFVYKLFDKRDKFLFYLVCMPHFQNNIPSSIFCGSIFSEFLCIARCTLKLEHFLPRASELHSRIL